MSVGTSMSHVRVNSGLQYALHEHTSDYRGASGHDHAMRVTTKGFVLKIEVPIPQSDTVKSDFSVPVGIEGTTPHFLPQTTVLVRVP